LHADDQKWQPNNDLAYYDTIEPGNEFGHNIDLEDAPSGSDFNIYDIEEEPMESPPTESMLKKSKNYSHRYPQVSFIRKKAWPVRIFRKIDKGSIRGSVFTLISGAVGAGVLSLPKVVSYFGLAMGIVVLLFNALLAYASYWA
jgi:hypothetical protein